VDDCQDHAQSHQAALCKRPEDPCALCRGISGVRVARSEELLQGEREMFILHAGQVYRLIRTRNDKLILQK